MKTLLFLFPVLALGCLHFDKNYKYKMEEGTKTAFLFHDGTQAHLVVRTDVKVSRGSLPDVLAWVMPFPALPTRYEEVEPAIFDDLGKITHPKKNVWDAPVRGQKHIPKASGKLIIHEIKLVGKYQVQPIEIVDPDAGQDFNKWLTQNQFNPMPLELQKPYMKKGAVFLAIKAKLQGRAANLKPLHILYPSDTLSFPLKFTHDTRTFDLDLFVFTPASVKEVPQGFRIDSSGAYVASMISESLPTLYAMVGEREGYITLFQGRGFNKKGQELKKIPSDPVFQFK